MTPSRLLQREICMSRKGNSARKQTLPQGIRCEQSAIKKTLTPTKRKENSSISRWPSFGSENLHKQQIEDDSLHSHPTK